MPRFDRDPAASGPLIQGFSGQGLRIDGQYYDGVLLTPLTIHGWQAPPLADLSLNHLGVLLELDPSPEFLILGTGANMARAPRALIEQLEERGIGVEAMDSRAAARTWGILRGEERWIAAAIMPL
ncbi:MAG: Mth938-like domain-containing protein [Allosphingosinicella sp.]